MVTQTGGSGLRFSAKKEGTYTMVPSTIGLS